MSTSHRVCLFGIAIMIAQAVPAAAQAAAAGNEIAQLRAEIADLRRELEALKQLVTGPAAAGSGRISGGPFADAEGSPVPVVSQPPQPDPRIEILQTQVAELAQSKVESTTKFPVKVFGAVHTHAFANSGEPNWLDVPNIVQPALADGRSGTFSATVRQTRLGFTADGPTIGSARTTGVLAVDFFAGIPGFQTGQVMPLPRLLVGYARIETDRVALQAGQDHVILAPRDPSSLAAFAFPLLFRSGNLYLRAPHARVEGTIASNVRVTAGITAPIGGDLVGEDYRFVPPALGGERSRHPAFQAHLGYASTAAADAPRRVAVGISGHFGRERRADAVHESWAGAVDFALRRDRIGFAGELFAGDNVDAFGGAMGLDARAEGGWAEVQLFPTARLAAAAGAGVDRLRGDAVAVPRRRNRSFFGNFKYSLTPEVDAGFEYTWLATLPGTGEERRNHHFDWVLVFRF
jgi:hypothetical protein